MALAAAVVPARICVKWGLPKSIVALVGLKQRLSRHPVQISDNDYYLNIGSLVNPLSMASVARLGATTPSQLPVSKVEISSNETLSRPPLRN